MVTKKGISLQEYKRMDYTCTHKEDILSNMHMKNMMYFLIIKIVEEVFIKKAVRIQNVSRHAEMFTANTPSSDSLHL